MKLTEETITIKLQEYNLGKLHSIQSLESGFESDNVKITTEKGDYVARILYHPPDKVNFAMKIYDFFVSNGIKTPKPIKTINQKYIVNIDPDKSFVIQEYITGKGVEREKLNEYNLPTLLPFYGKELGKFHLVGCKWQETSRTSIISDVYELNSKYLHLPQDPFVLEEYKKWKRIADELDDFSFSKGMIHGDIKPYDFFLNNGELSGIMDLNSARHDILLADLAALLMYTDLWQEKNKDYYLLFIESYLQESSLKSEELIYLQFILTTRAFIQTMHFSYRIIHESMQGIDDLKENQKGFVDGRNFIKEWTNIPKNYFFDVLK